MLTIQPNFLGNTAISKSVILLLHFKAKWRGVNPLAFKNDQTGFFLNNNNAILSIRVVWQTKRRTLNWALAAKRLHTIWTVPLKVWSVCYLYSLHNALDFHLRRVKERQDNIQYSKNYFLNNYQLPGCSTRKPV